jgi:hypothetical protein
MKKRMQGEKETQLEHQWQEPFSHLYYIPQGKQSPHHWSQLDR